MPSGVYKHNPWSEEPKLRLREVRRLKPNHWLGRTHTEETKAKIRTARARQVFSTKTRMLWSRNRTGRKDSPETIAKKILSLPRGSNHHFWKGGITPKSTAIRMSHEYKTWRQEVFERDDYTCVICQSRGGDLNADHIKPFSLYPELRFNIENGRTVCVPCHRNTSTYGGRIHSIAT